MKFEDLKPVIAECSLSSNCSSWGSGIPPATPGVYALYLNSECLYVGQSMNMRKRTAYHPVKWEWPNPDVFWVECKNRVKLERWFISQLRPKLNVQTRDKSNRKKKPKKVAVIVSEAAHKMLLNYCARNGTFIQAVADSAIRTFLANEKKGKQ